MLYLSNYARPFVYSNSMPHCHIESLQAILDLLSSPAGDQLRNDLYSNAIYFESRLRSALSINNQTVLALSQPSPNSGLPQGFTSPCIPVFSPNPSLLVRYLQSLGYDSQAILYPVVPKGTQRIRIMVHAGHTHKDLDDMIDHLVEWIRLNVEGDIIDANVSVDNDISSKEVTNASPKNADGHSLTQELISPFPPFNHLKRKAHTPMEPSSVKVFKVKL